MEHKACINTLETMKVGSSRVERAAIDQAIDAVKKMHKIKKWIKDKDKDKDKDCEGRTDNE